MSRKCKSGEKLVNGECIKTCAVKNPSEWNEDAAVCACGGRGYIQKGSLRKVYPCQYHDKSVMRDIPNKGNITPDLYLTMSTGRAQQTGQYGRTYGVIYQGQSMMATTLDKDKALRVLNETAKELGQQQSLMMWDGDKGTFIWMGED